MNTHPWKLDDDEDEDSHCPGLRRQGEGEGRKPGEETLRELPQEPPRVPVGTSRRQIRQGSGRPAPVPGQPQPRRHRASGQQPGWRDHLRHGHPGRHGRRQVRSCHRGDGASRLHGCGDRRLRQEGQALRLEAQSRHDPPALDFRHHVRPASDIQIQAEEMLRIRRELNQLLAEASGKTLEQLEIDTDRDNIMTATEACEYGLVDKVENFS
jgi:hypothetical protein